MAEPPTGCEISLMGRILGTGSTQSACVSAPPTIRADVDSYVCRACVNMTPLSMSDARTPWNSGGSLWPTLSLPKTVSTNQATQLAAYAPACLQEEDALPGEDLKMLHTEEFTALTICH